MISERVLIEGMRIMGAVDRVDIKLRAANKTGDNAKIAAVLEELTALFIKVDWDLFGEFAQYIMPIKEAELKRSKKKCHREKLVKRAA